MALNERDLFLAMIGRTRQLWAEHLVGLEPSQDEKRAWDNYQWLHDQTQLYFTSKFDGGLHATPQSLNEPFTREYRRRILHALDNGKEVVGARVPVIFTVPSGHVRLIAMPSVGRTPTRPDRSAAQGATIFVIITKWFFS
jgi:hypothetical protein